MLPSTNHRLNRFLDFVTTPSLPLRAEIGGASLYAELEPSSLGCTGRRSRRGTEAASGYVTPKASKTTAAQPIHVFFAPRRQHRMKVVLALAMGAAALAPNQPQVAGKVAAKAAGAAALGAAMTLSSVPAFAAIPPPKMKGTESERIARAA